MLICLNGFNYFKTHKHPAEVSESYHMIEGKIDIIFFDDNENIIEKVSLGSNKEDNFIYRLSSPYFHLVLPQTETVIYQKLPLDHTIKLFSMQHLLQMKMPQFLKLKSI